MIDTEEDKLETRFTAQGSLRPPGPVGRIVRLLLGAWLISALVSLIGAAQDMIAMDSVPRNISFWLFVLIALHITPYVVNIGLERNWRRRSQAAVLIAAGVLIALDMAFFGRVWAPPLAVFLLVWLSYFSAHLGVSFVISAFIATPGCEMRALPHLWTLITGRPTREHYCPGPIDTLDKWEMRRRSS